MDDNIGCGCLIYIVVAVIAVLATYLIYNAVMAADIPIWIKYLLLR